MRFIILTVCFPPSNLHVAYYTAQKTRSQIFLSHVHHMTNNKSGDQHDIVTWHIIEWKPNWLHTSPLTKYIDKECCIVLDGRNLHNSWELLLHPSTCHLISHMTSPPDMTPTLSAGTRSAAHFPEVFVVAESEFLDKRAVCDWACILATWSNDKWISLLHNY